MTDGGDNMDVEAQQLEMKRQSHLAWLREQKADFAAHQARNQRGLFREDGYSGGGQQLDDEEPVYRSLNIAGPLEAAREVEDEPVYRSLDLSAMGISETLPSPDPNSTWVAAKRPPLLRRQNAFAIRDEEPEWWSGLQGPTGRVG